LGSDSGDRQSTGQQWDGDTKPLVLSGEPMLQYQPVVDLGTGKLLGFEALMRWQHPTQGVILPGLLIPWAEANGDIVALGDWVLHASCRDASRWPASVQLAVNLSIVQLRRGVASTAVRKALEESGLPADRLTVEVTEHVMSDEYALRDLRAIAATGVQLAVDDVGTSWNSFELLRRMAVNTIKIDASFVNGLEAHEGINRMVVETVVHLAHSSGMSTVAEGVETELHAQLVREFDSDAAQGYYFAPPLSVERAAAMAAMTEHRFPLEGGGWAELEMQIPDLSALAPEQAASDAETLFESGGAEEGAAPGAHEGAADDVPADQPEGDRSDGVDDPGVTDPTGGSSAEGRRAAAAPSRVGRRRRSRRSEQPESAPES